LDIIKTFQYLSIAFVRYIKLIKPPFAFFDNGQQPKPHLDKLYEQLIQSQL